MTNVFRKTVLGRLLPALAVFSLAGCMHRYEPSDAVMKGDHPVVPAEFKNGTATLEQTKTWSASLLSYMQTMVGDKPSLKIIEEDLNQDGVDDLLVAETQMAGTGGNSYLAFEHTPNGYRYLGKLSFGSIRILPKDGVRQQTFILTAWHMSSGEAMVAFVSWDANGFHELAHVPVRAGDGGTAEGNQDYDALFRAKVVLPETLKRIFGI